MLDIDLDATDIRILNELQRDASLTNVELASRVSLSPSPCLARVKQLELDIDVREAERVRLQRELADYLTQIVDIDIPGARCWSPHPGSTASCLGVTRSFGRHRHQGHRIGCRHRRR